MNWQVLVLIHSLIAAISILTVRILAKNGNKYVYSVLFYSFIFLWLLGCIIAFFLLDGALLPKLQPGLIGHLALGGILFGLTNYLVFEVLRNVPATVASINLTLNRIFAVLFAVLFLDEKLNTSQIFGAVMMLIAVALVSYHRKHKKLTNTYLKSLTIIFFMAIAYGIATVNEKYLLDEMGIRSYLIFGWFFQVLAVTTLVFLRRSKWKMPGGKLRKVMWLQVLLFASSALMFISSLVLSDSSSKTVSAAGFKVVLSVFLGYLLLKERQHPKRLLVATMLSFAGIMLLF